MRFLLCILGLLNAIFFTHAQLPKNLDALEKYEVQIKITDNSHINILGKTNVNKFKCNYYGEVSGKEINTTIYRDGKSILINNATLQITVNYFDCGIKQMTSDFKELLQQDKYPFIQLQVLSISPKKISDLSSNYTASIALTIAGVENCLEVPLNITQENDMSICKGRMKINIEDFELTPPTKFIGLVKVDREIELDLQLVLSINLLKKLSRK